MNIFKRNLFAHLLRTSSQFLLLLSLFGCTQQQESPPTVKEAPPAPFTILKTVVIDTLSTHETRLFVQVPQVINADSLNAIAEELHLQHREDLDLLIYYYLGTQPQRKGPYASARFGPDLATQIHPWSRSEHPLPEIGFPTLDNPFTPEKNPVSDIYFDLYLGYESVNGERQPRLNFDGEQSIRFSELGEAIDTFRERIPEFQRGRIAVQLHIDQDLPFIYVQYTKALLAFHGQLKLSFVYNETDLLNMRSPPYAERDYSCDGRPGEPSRCRKGKYFAPEQIALIQSDLNPFWNPTVERLDFAALLRPENLFHIVIDASGLVRIKDQEVASDHLTDKIYQIIDQHESPPRLVFILQTHHQASYQDYLTSYIAIKAGYDRKWEELSIEKGAPSFKEADWRAQREVKNEVPYVVAEEIF